MSDPTEAELADVMKRMAPVYDLVPTVKLCVDCEFHRFESFTHEVPSPIGTIAGIIGWEHRCYASQCHKPPRTSLVTGNTLQDTGSEFRKCEDNRWPGDDEYPKCGPDAKWFKPKEVTP